MKKFFVHPKNKTQQLLNYSFNNGGIYIFIGLIILGPLLAGFTIVSFHANIESKCLHYESDYDNVNHPPDWFCSNTSSTNNQQINEDDALTDLGEENSLNNNMSSDDEFLFNQEYSNENDSVENTDSEQSDFLRNKIFILGTNSEGRDLFTNLFLGLEIYLIGGFFAIIISLVLGTIMGSISAYYENSFLSYFTNFFEAIINSIPKILILFLSIIIFGVNIYSIMITIGLISSVKISDGIAQKVKQLKSQEFVDSAKQLGLSDFNILARHILFYNCRDVFIVYSIFIFADAILLESTLAYLNFGVDWYGMLTDLPVKSWGTFLAEGKRYWMYGYYWMVLFPAVFILLLINAVNFIGEGLKNKFHLN